MASVSRLVRSRRFWFRGERLFKAPCSYGVLALAFHGSSCILTFLKGPYTALLRTLVPKAVPGTAFGTGCFEKIGAPLKGALGPFFEGVWG